ncbi:SH3 domain-containing protein [Exiguobacterium sp. FSL W8-0210]|uniref:C40 family peptidase n=1 Tax=Exiguobacterium sp. FSL W8-0210 TaxID=2921598 RepID=UPI0030F66BE7
MKKTVLALTTLALVGTTIPVSAASTTLTLTDNVNIRTAASTSAKVITTLKKGTKLTAVKKVNSWYEIRYQSKPAFITSAYVKATTEKAPTTTTYITNTDAVNVRQKATTSSKSLGKLAKNTVLTVQKQSGDWYQITHKKQTAYVHATLVSKKTSNVTTDSKPPATTPVKKVVKAVDRSKVYTVNAKEGLNARTAAATNAKIYKTLPHQTVLDVTGAVDSWYQVKLDGKEAYVASTYVKASTKASPPTTPTTPEVSLTPVDASKTYRVNAPTGLNVRTLPSTSSKVFTQVAHASTVNVTGETTGKDSGWYQIKIGTGLYYVAKSYITTGSVTTTPPVTPTTPPVTTVPGSTLMERAISIGQQYLGTPYVWGSSNPVNGGFDCSGFINYTLNAAGYSVGRTNVNGYWNDDRYLGAKLSKLRQPARGDIIFFENTYAAGPTHIGIMLNNDQFIHANTPSLGISRLSERYWTQKLLGFKSL